MTLFRYFTRLSLQSKGSTFSSCDEVKASGYEACLSTLIENGSRRWSARMTFLKKRLAAERSRFAESMNEGGGTLLIEGTGTAYFHWLPTLTNAPVHAVRGARQLQVRADAFVDFRGVALSPTERRSSGPPRARARG